MDNCLISCQVIADMKKVQDDLIIINLYFSLSKNCYLVIFCQILLRLWWDLEIGNLVCRFIQILTPKCKRGSERRGDFQHVDLIICRWRSKVSPLNYQLSQIMIRHDLMKPCKLPASYLRVECVATSLVRSIVLPKVTRENWFAQLGSQNY